MQKAAQSIHCTERLRQPASHGPWHGGRQEPCGRSRSSNERENRASQRDDVSWAGTFFSCRLPPVQIEPQHVVGELSFLHKSPPRFRETALQLKSIPDAHRACQAPIFGAPRKFSTNVAIVWNVCGQGRGEAACGRRSIVSPMRGDDFSPLIGARQWAHGLPLQGRWVSVSEPGRVTATRSHARALHPSAPSGAPPLIGEAKTGDTPFSPNAGDGIKGPSTPVKKTWFVTVYLWL